MPVDRVLARCPTLERGAEPWISPATDEATSTRHCFPYVRTRAYALLNVSADCALARNAWIVAGFKNIGADNYAPAWGLPQPGRTYYVKTRLGL